MAPNLTDRLVPTNVLTSGVLSGKTIVSLLGGGYHTVALCSDGTVADWGFNSNGQLGNNSTTDSYVPVLVSTSGVLSGKTIVSVSAAFNHSLAQCSDGTLVAWGDNFDGALGINSTTDSYVPVAVSTTPLGQAENYMAVSAGASSAHSLGLIASPPPPVATTLSATALSTTATLNGSVIANGVSTNVFFDYGLTNSYGTTVSGTPTPVTGNTATAVSAPVGGLSRGTLYHLSLIHISEPTRLGRSRMPSSA